MYQDRLLYVEEHQPLQLYLWGVVRFLFTFICGWMCWSTQMDSFCARSAVVAVGTFSILAASASALPYSFYDDLRQSRTATFAPLIGGGGDASTGHVGRNLHAVSGDAVDGELTLCHVPTFFRWSQASSDAPGGYNDVSSEAYGGTSAALLAMHHFNTGDGTIAPDLNRINERCPIRLTMETIDSTSSGIKAVQELTCLLYTSPSPRDRSVSRMPSSA